MAELFSQLFVNRSPVTDCENFNQPLFSVDLVDDVFLTCAASLASVPPKRCHLRSCAIAQVSN
jgi:hypothetical protein